jgi:hypothetical protein
MRQRTKTFYSGKCLQVFYAFISITYFGFFFFFGKISVTQIMGIPEILLLHIYIPIIFLLIVFRWLLQLLSIIRMCIR